MTTQPSLFGVVTLVTPEHEPGLTIQERHEAWIAVNGWVLDVMETLVARWLSAGHSRVGVKQMWEVIRFEYGATTGDTFKANNNWTSRVARSLIERRPEWAEVIETRELRAA